MLRGALESSVLIYWIVVVAAVVLVGWALIMVIRVAHRWLQLHPAPPRDRATGRSDS